MIPVGVLAPIYAGWAYDNTGKVELSHLLSKLRALYYNKNDWHVFYGINYGQNDDGKYYEATA